MSKLTRYNTIMGLMCNAAEVERLEALNAELLEALEKALLMCDKMTDGNGPYKYIDGTQLVSDAYDTSNLLKQAIAKAKGEEL